MPQMDTDILIDLLRKHTPTVEWLRSLPEPPDIPGYAAMELYQGCHNKREADAVSKLLRRFLIVWPSPMECNAALHHFSTLKLSHGIGVIDCLIAACAVERSVMLYSFNIRHFAAYPGLTVERPYIKS